MSNEFKHDLEWVIQNLRWYLHEGYDEYAQDFAKIWSPSVKTNWRLLIEMAKSKKKTFGVKPKITSKRNKSIKKEE